MARKYQCNINLDKLRISFFERSDINYFAILRQYRNGEKYYINNYYYLYISDDGRGPGDAEVREATEPNHINAELIIKDMELGINDMKLGTFTFNSTNRYDGRIFFKVENKVLYNVFSILQGEKKSHLCAVFDVLHDMNLEVASITEMEIAVDKNTNTLKTFNRLLKDTENYEMIVNGNVINNPKEIISKVHKCFGFSREKTSRYPTIYIEQVNNDAPRLKIYNKSKEIEKNTSKKYVEDWNEFGDLPIYRTELTIFWCDIKAYMRANRLSLTDPLILEKLTDPDRLAHLFESISPRLLRFNSPDGERITPIML